MSIDRNNELPILPNHKPHVSYSEIRNWKECPWRHKLAYIDKVDMFEPSPYLSYGTAVHDGIENFLLTGEMNIENVLSEIKKEWTTHGFDSADWIKSQADYRASQGWKPKPHVYISEWLDYARNSLEEIPDFLKKTFGEYEVVSAEEELYEHVPEVGAYFKGFIDALIKTKDHRGKEIYWVIDWKTAGDKGWYANKRRDILTWAQIALYKHFWRTKSNIDIKSVRCGFVLLKRGAPAGNTCELVKVSVGPKAEEKCTSILRSMVLSMKRGIFLKNRNSCLFCDYKGTEYCTGS
ncbi:MAG: hypothetical protein CMB77_04425 [Euryarchaeota archaeon]|nr:hypothetical protein [Euryarchaeota archaeon]|tara:strand:+ start:22174 stop:23052 length:879 start_codon:yes stop_codon:yes gene_type:complete